MKMTTEQKELMSEFEIIKSMIERTRQNTVDRGAFFLLWGYLVFFANISTFICLTIHREEYVWIPWAVLMPLGAIVSIILVFRYRKNEQYKSYVEQASHSVWIACGIAFLIVGFIGPYSFKIDHTIINPMIALLAGIGVFASGGIMEWNPLRIGGLFLFAGVVFMLFTPANLHPLIMAIVIIPGYLVPGYMLKNKYKPVDK